MSNWAYNLDLLAQNGVLDFDAPSFVMGTPPRYGNPSPFGGEVPQPIKQPEQDEFKKPDETNFVHTPMWKKALFTVVSTSLLIYGACKLKAVGKFFKKCVNKLFGKKP